MGGGGKGGGQGRYDAGAAIPPGFRRTTKSLGKELGGFIRDPRFSGILGQSLDFYSNLQDSPEIAASTNALMQDIEAPTSLTDPLFLRQREQLGATLNEEARRRGGLYSSGAQEVVAEGLGQFTDQYISSAAQRRSQAAQALFGQQLNLGQALFTPYQAATSPLTGFLRSQQQGQQQYGNKAGSTAQTIAQGYGTYKSSGGPY